MQQVLIIDDQEKLRQLLSRIIALEGFEVIQAGTLSAGLKKLDQHGIDLILCDVKLPDGDGVTFVKEVKAKFPDTEIILLTAYGNIEDGVEAMRNGAFDYITKGDDNNKIVPLLHKVTEKIQLKNKVYHLEKRLECKKGFSAVIGISDKISYSSSIAKKVAVTQTTVLLTGETGTGKEVFAQSIHEESTRNKHPFVAVNCASFGKELLESELFGHRAGSFTGALKDKKGLLEEAEKGTLFLDEIGELPLELQAKMLRVLELGEYFKIGDTKTIKANVRIIAATNRQLEKEIAAGHFREDLFYRISVFSIHIPPLRERIEDIPLLANHFLSLFSERMGKKTKGFSEECLHLLKNYFWKGNIRELKNIIERGVILLEPNQFFTEDFLPSELRWQGEAFKEAENFKLSSAEKVLIKKVMQITCGNKTKTAEMLGIGLTTLYRKLEEYSI